jgi:hypothetical protein
MSPAWQDDLRIVSASLQVVTTPARDLWHGRLLSADGLVDEEDAWQWVAVHESLARKPIVAADRSVPHLWLGRFFGNPDGLSCFRGLADAAFRCLLQGGQLTVKNPESMPRRCHSSYWMNILYDIAESADDQNPVLLARTRSLHSPTQPWTGDGEMQSRNVKFTFLERDVFTCSVAAIGMLLNEVPPERLNIDLESNSLTLDGITYTDLDPVGLRIIQALAQRMRSGEGPLSGKQLSQLVPGCSGGEKTVRRHLRSLPEPVQALVKGKPGAGRWLQLPPPK